MQKINLLIRGKNLVAMLVFCAGLFLSLLSFFLLRDKENKSIRIRFEALASDRVEQIENAFEDNLSMLYVLRDFYASSMSVERQEFRTFTKGLLSRHPDIFEFRWLLRIGGNERESYEESMRKEGFTGLKIKEFDNHYDLINAASRQEYFCVTYIEPDPEDKLIFGVDVSSDQLRRKAMQEARDHDTAVSTGKIRVVGEKEDKYAIRTFLPVYANALPHNTLQERRDNLKGFLVLLFQIDKMTELSLGFFSPEGINIYIYDRTEDKKGELLYFHSSRMDTMKAGVTGIAGIKEVKGFELEKIFNAAGRKWSIICRPTSRFFAARRSWDIWGSLAFGIILTLVAVAYVSSLASRSARIEALVEKRTRELKESEAQVQRAADEWKNTFDSMVDLIFIQDKDFNILRVNKAFCEAFKSRPEDLIGRKCYEVVHNTDKPWPGCPSVKVFSEHRPHIEEIFDKNIGIPLLVRVSPIFDKDGKLIGSVHIATDISERKKAEDKIKEAMRVKSEFTSVVSHELRTPLTAIREGICIVLEGSAGKVNEEQKDFLSVAKRNVDRLWRLINDILDYQRLDSDRMEYDIKENDLNVLVGEVEEAMRPLAQKKNLEFSVSLADNLAKVKCDRDRITQVLTNLVNNAIKFTDKGSIVISTHRRENSVVVSVRDTGKGIRQEDMDKLFQAFSQISWGKEREMGSTGLGLVISKKIIRQHGGQIWAESECGRGSTFSFLLPLVG